MRNNPGQNISLILAFIVMALIFALDYYMPSGYDVWLLYIIPIFFTSFKFNTSYTYTIASLTTLLTAVSYFRNIGQVFSPGEIANRALGLLLIWVAALLMIKKERTDRALRENEELFRASFDQAAVGIGHLSSTGQWLRVNQKHCDIVGYPRNELLSKTFFDITYPEDLEKERKYFDELRDGKISTYSIEKRFVRKDGSLVWTHVTRSALRDIQGKARLFITVVQDISQRKLIEDSLRESEERLRLAVINSPFPIIIHSEDGGILLISRAFTEITGYSAEDIPTVEKWAEKIYTDRKDIMLEYIQRLYSLRGSIKEGEFLIITREGEKRIWDFSSASIGRLPDGRRLIISIAMDVTEEKKKQSLIRIQQNRLALLAELSKSFAAARLDFKTVINIAVRRISAINEDICIIRVLSDDKLTLDHSAIYHPDKQYMNDISLISKEILQTKNNSFTWDVIRSGKIKVINNIDYEDIIKTIKPAYQNLARKVKPSSILIAPLRVSGETIGVLSLARNHTSPGFTSEDEKFFQEIADRIAIAVLNAKLYNDRLNEIEERKRTEKLLTESEQKFRTMADSLPQILWTAGSNGTIDYYNKRWVEFSGLLQSEGKLRGWRPVLHPEDRTRTFIAWRNSVKTGNIYQIEHRIRRTDGTYHWFLTRGLPMFNPEGEIIKWFGSSTDIDDQIKIKQALERTLEELDRSNKELEQFAYIASHDLQEPLRMVSSYTQLLSKKYRGYIDGKADEFITYIEEGAHRMQRLILDLLNYSRITSKGKAFGSVDCEAIYNYVLHNLHVTIAETGTRITHDPLPVITGDDMQIMQLFQNLISNAIKFRGSNPPEIHLGIKSMQNEWLFCVKDNGIGIDTQYKDRIFVIFQRLHDRDMYPGTGIGLAICKKIVERHRGRIWVESEPGKGSTFYFTISKKRKLS